VNRIPANGEKVVCPQFSGVGIIQSVKVLKCLANVVWPSGLRTWTPLEELEPADALTGASPTASVGSKP
jgi:hypothetical protein